MKKAVIDQDSCWAEAPVPVWDILYKMQESLAASITVKDLPDAIARAQAAGSEWCYYDMENIWPACGVDLKDPLAAIAKAGRLIRAAGLRPMMANYWDSLAFKQILPYPKDVLWSKWWKAQARAGDAVDIQLPGYPQNNPQQFGEMTMRAVDLIRKTNPDVEFILINMIEYMSDSKQSLETAWEAAKPYVDGRWVWE